MEPITFALLGLLASLIGYILGTRSKGGNGSNGKSGNNTKGPK